MQENILILSRCLKRIGQEPSGSYYQFHFKGFFCGDKINLIQVQANEGQLLELGEDYLLWVKYLHHSRGILEVNLIKHKRIS